MTQIDLTDYDVPGRGRGLVDLIRWRYLLGLLVRKGTATRYRNSVLGWTWSYVKPLSQFVIYYFVMGVILQFHRDIENFPIYLFSGVIIVNLFNEAFGNATNSIVENRALVNKIYLPRELFPAASVIVALIHFAPQMLVLLVICLLVGWTPTIGAVLGAVGAVILIVAFATGLGLFFGGINVRFRDAQNFVEIIRMFATWTSPVLYTWMLVRDVLSGPVFAIYMSNPLSVAVELFHHGFWNATVEQQQPFPPLFWAYSIAGVAACLIMLVVGQTVFRKMERTFAQDL
ncbi:ABC transporter permease [Microbacterium sp. zg.Y1090]|uniref:ABC transporter permease n=1 Tax=Microbacterium wangruii TaxID=3049073 RepID=UPI00214CC8D6|nr:MULTISPECIES: ABC transporter permease [unclassified Microbacterium]MCR2818055.1 ABC transporter permease [Microbacterium sp. zg.Y1090]WIM27787.1 ABC transporter permease [Microbacterium sp. zg-Y1090]